MARQRDLLGKHARSKSSRSSQLLAHRTYYSFHIPRLNWFRNSVPYNQLFAIRMKDPLQRLGLQVSDPSGLVSFTLIRSASHGNVLLHERPLQRRESAEGADETWQMETGGELTASSFAKAITMSFELLLRAGRKDAVRALEDFGAAIAVLQFHLANVASEMRKIIKF